MTRLHLFFFSIIFLVLSSCAKKKEIKINGYYEIDKKVFRSRNNNIPDFRFIKVNHNNTFELQHTKADSTSGIKGKLEIVNTDNTETTVYFIYNNKQVRGTLKGTIFYFTYPNDFHGDKYESLIYVKLKTAGN